jgi:hypothetical protein
MKYIKLTQGKHTIVDDEDFEFLNQRKWHYDTRYATRTQWNKETKKETKIYMHRLILPDVKEVDHINGNKLDNRKENLRACNRKQNSRNQSTQKRKKSSKYKGVIFDKSRSKWRVELKKNQIRYYVGRFLTEKEAGLAYNEKAKELFGEFARLNVIED